MNVATVTRAALEAGLLAAKGHAEDVRTYLKTRARILAQGAAAIIADRASGKIDDDDVKFAWGEIKAAEKTRDLAVKATAKAAAQDAINAALAVVETALSAATGIVFL